MVEDAPSVHIIALWFRIETSTIAAPALMMTRRIADAHNGVVMSWRAYEAVVASMKTASPITPIPWAPRQAAIRAMLAGSLIAPNAAAPASMCGTVVRISAAGTAMKITSRNPLS